MMLRIERSETLAGSCASMIESSNGPATAIDADELTPEDFDGRPWDLVDFLDTDDDVARLLAVAFESDDRRHLTACFADVARAYGRAELARNTDCRRESLYSVLAGRGDICAETVRRTLDDFGLHLARAPETEYAAEPAFDRAVADEPHDLDQAEHRQRR